MICRASVHSISCLKERLRYVLDESKRFTLKIFKKMLTFFTGPGFWKSLTSDAKSLSIEIEQALINKGVIKDNKWVK